MNVLATVVHGSTMEVEAVKMNKILYLILLGIAATSGFVMADRYFSEEYVLAQQIQNQFLPIATANPIPCTMSINQAAERANFAFSAKIHPLDTFC